MIDSILDSILSTLSNNGIHAVRAFPTNPIPSPPTPVVCVGILSSRSLSSAFGDYIGTVSDPATLLDRELYALRLELEISLDIFAPFGSNPTAAFDDISRALADLPDGLRVAEIRCGNSAPDKLSDMLKTPVTLKCSAYLTASLDEDSSNFSDFVLKGVPIT